MKGNTVHRHSATRHEIALEPRHFDPYLEAGKPGHDAVCPDCHAVFRNGRWAWGNPPKHATHERCPACLRIRDRFPGGYVTLRGAFVDAHREELRQLVATREAHEKAEHPLERLMSVKDGPHAIEISTTGTHLARQIASAVKAAYEGQLNTRYLPDENLVRVVWTRQ
jgi:NMD protein affecting ribosome stability and mRNA decay